MSLRQGIAVRDGERLEADFSAISIGPKEVGCNGLGGTIAFDSYPRTLQATLGGGFIIEGNRQINREFDAGGVDWCPPYIIFSANAMFDALPVILFNRGSLYSWRSCTAGYQLSRILRQTGGSSAQGIWDGPNQPPDPCAVSRWCTSNLSVWLTGYFILSADLVPNGGHLTASFSLQVSDMTGITFGLDIQSFPFSSTVHLSLPPNTTDPFLVYGNAPAISERINFTRFEVRNLTLDFNLNQS